MNTKIEDRKKVLIEYMKELTDKFDQNQKTVDKKKKELNKLVETSEMLVEEMQLISELLDRVLDPININKDIPTKRKLQMVAGLPLNIFDGGPFTVVEALKKVFESNPRTLFEPVSLKNILGLFKERNMLKTEAENLLWITHSGLKTLLRENYIEKVQNGKPKYRKKLMFDVNPILVAGLSNLAKAWDKLSEKNKKKGNND